MGQRLNESMGEFRVEVLPPERERRRAGDTAICPCCDTVCPASSMDDDGCGICDECLAP